jgi:polyisoprenoid-binding protein YceI
MTTLYRLEPESSRFTVQAFAVGLLSFMGHSPTFTVRDFTGTVGFEDDLIAKLRLELVVRAGSLRVVGEVGQSDRDEIETRMQRGVLDVAGYPEIAFRGSAAETHREESGRYRVRLDGELSLRGVTRAHPLDAELLMFSDGLRLRGETRLRMSEYGIEPVTALGGAIRLKDDLRLVFDLIARPEAS